VVSALTAFALIVHGYHPYVEDGGLYVAGVKKLLDPQLYPAWTEFVTEHLRFSVFAPVVAALVRGTHLSLPWVLLLLYLGSTWATLYAAWMILVRTTDRVTGRCGGVTLLACWLTMPIAGTSLMLMDPYVTARSFSTPLALLAVAWAVDGSRGSLRGWVLAGLAIAAAAVVHPLMAGYALAAVIVLACVGARDARVRRWGPWCLAAGALVAAAGLYAKSGPESAEYVRVAMTRYYWFPFQWEWYEQVGLIAPLGLLAVLLRGRLSVAGRMAIALGLISLLVAVVFSRAGLTHHLVARMQPLRCFQMVYEVMILLLGAWVGERVLRRAWWRWALLLGVFGVLFFYVQRNTFPASTHLEMPWRAERNPWVRAFVWARENTAKDALFALDARYITRDGEDAQCFRPIAERSALADYSKDGGEASITPDLTDAWVLGQSIQTDLNTENDAVRSAKLAGRGVSWVVLRQDSVTSWRCAYQNDTAKVCAVP